VSDLVPKIWPNAPAMVYQKYFPLYLALGVIVLPFTLVSDLAGFRGMSWMCFFLEILSICCVLLALVRSIETSSFNPDGQITFFSSDWKVIFNSFINFNTVLFIHPFVPFVLKDLKSPTVSRCLQSMWTGTTVSFALCFVGQLLSFFLFTKAERFDDIFCFLPLDNPEVVIGVVSNAIISLCSSGMYTVMAARTISGAILGESVNSRIPNFMSGLVVVCFACFAMFMDDMYQEGIDVVASIAMVFLEYAFPPVFYLYEFRFSRPLWAVMAIVTLVVGFGPGIVACYLNVKDMTQGVTAYT
jgi:hypothetical protein